MSGGRTFFLVLVAIFPVRGIAAEERPLGDRELRAFVAAGQSFHPENQGFAEFGSPVVQWGRFLSRRLEALVEAQPLFVVNQPRFPPYGERETVEAFAVDVGLRWYFAPTAWSPKPCGTWPRRPGTPLGSERWSSGAAPTAPRHPWPSRPTAPQTMP